MSPIARLIEYLEKYGNCQIFLTCENTNRNHILNFSFYKDFSIGVTELSYAYNKPFWNGKEFDETAILLGTDFIRSSYSYKSLHEYIAHIVKLSIKSGDSCGITYKRNALNIDTKNEVDKICRMVYSMLYLSNMQLVEMAEIVNFDTESMLKNNMVKNLGIDDDFELNSGLIDKKVMHVKERYNALCSLRNTLYSHLSLEEYAYLYDRWNKYRNDKSSSKILYQKIPKK